MDGQTLGRVEVNTVLAADGEKLSRPQISRVQLDDVTVVVFPGAGPVHHRDEVHVLTGRVAHGFRPVESLYDANLARGIFYGISGIMARLLGDERRALLCARGDQLEENQR